MTNSSCSTRGSRVVDLLALFCFLALSAPGCTWSAKHRDVTLAHFKEHAVEYQALIDSIKKSPGGEYSRHEAILKSIEVQPTTPPIVEVTPVDFYYVLVHAEDEVSLASSGAMRDEGRYSKDWATAGIWCNGDSCRLRLRPPAIGGPDERRTRTRPKKPPDNLAKLG